MPIALFARAEGEPGFNYELANGVVEVTNIPGLDHHRVVRRIVKLLTGYEIAHPGVIQSMGGGAEAKIELWGADSERHPDVSVYLSPPPKGVDQPWDRWIPEIVIEVVSASSAKRDYKDKPKDYLAAGVREYWIIDPLKRAGTFLTRRADVWLQKRLTVRGKWTTPLLPAFTLELARVLQKTTKR